MKALILTLALLTIPGSCSHKTTQAGSLGPNSSAVQNVTVASQTVQEDTRKLDAGRAEQDKKTQDTLSKLKANVTAAKSYNEDNPEGKPKEKVRNELTVAEGRLDGVQPDKDEMIASQQRALLVEQGKTSEARAAAEKAAEEAKANAAELIRIRVENEHLQRDRDQAIADQKRAQDELLREAKDNQAAMQARIDALSNEFMHKQAMTLTIAGLAFLGLFGLGLAFGGIGGLRLSWPFSLLGLECLGLAQLITQPWFKYACGGALVVALITLGVWIWIHYRADNLASAAQDKADHLKSILGAVVPTLDSAYDNAKQETKDLLDETVFKTLKDQMSPAQRATIHQIRAEQITASPSATPAA